MTVTREELNPCTVELKVSVPQPQVKEAFEKAFKKLTKNVKLPGFRPGTAPRHMLEQYVEPNNWMDVAADMIVRESFPKALEQEKLEPHSQPSIAITAIDKEEGKCEFTAKVPLEPKVELSEYKNLPVEKPKISVTDEEIQHQIDELRQGQATRTAITERGIQDGDVCVLNVKVDGEEGDGRNFMTIAGQTFPELDAALMGMKSDEIKSLELKFPENFQEKDWAGKKHKSQVSVRSISAVQLPTLDDSFAKSMKTESVDELKSRMSDAILRAKESMAVDYLNEQILEGLLHKSTVHVPDTMWEQVAARRLNDLVIEQQQKGKTMEDYAKEAGMSLEELVAAWQNEAKLHVQRAVIVQRIFELEKMQLAEADLNKELLAMAQEYQTDPRELFEAMRKQNALSELQFRSVFRKVTDFLRDSAKITEVEVGSAPAPSKPKKSKKG